MHKRAKVWAKDHLARPATKWTTRFRSSAPRKKERKITLSRGQRAGAASTWWRRLLGLDEGGYTRNLLDRLPFVGRGPRGPSRVVRPNTQAGVGVQTHAPQSFAGNKIHTHKYTALTFVPLNLYEQFKRLANLWFLIVAILHLIPEISSLNPAASLIPLIFVLGVTAIKEAVEDVKRRVEDTKLNNKKVTVYSSASGGFSSLRWKDIRVGDVIKLKNGEQVPADILLLNSSDADGLCYIETANLDGETNLKIRQALSETIEALEDEDSIPYFQGVVECEHPNAELYNFEGTLRMEYDADPVPINLDQTLWRGCTLRNTEWIYGLVINTGMDTKVMKNARKPPSKRSTLEKDMNRAIFSVLLLGVLLALIAAVFNGIWTSDKGFDHWYLALAAIHDRAFLHGLSSFGSWLILLNIIIPISLYVYMEMIKLVMALYINSDATMYHEETNTPARANTSNLAEELGQIEYVFSDKTGTLTSNQMNFMRCSVRGRLYGYPPDRIFEEDGSQVYIYQDEDLLKAVQGDKYDSDEARDAHLFFRSLALCHSVVIERHSAEPDRDQDQNDDGDDTEIDQSELDLRSEARLEYQAASPDEAALVIAAQKLGFELYDRDKESIYVRVLGLEERWELLNILEFNSDRKRMSVILRDPTTGVVRLFCKGADNVIFERLAPGQDELKQATFEHLATFGSEGLRTLVFATRVIPSDEYDAWNERYRQAALKIYGREEAMDAVGEAIEKDMELLGATAIEDKLQDGVPQAISTLMAAGLKMWVLTGDKMETAINIGYSCSLLTQDMKTLVLSSEEADEADDNSEDDNNGMSVVSPQTAIQALDRHFRRHFGGQVEPWSQAKIDEFLFSLSAGTHGKAPGMQEKDLQELHSNINNRGIEVDQTDENEISLDEEEGADEPRDFALVIDGKALSQYLPSSGAYNELSARFLELAMRCKAVICCRVSPLQKSLVVNLVKKGLKATTLSIGDGANDVPMIQAANVGVGISGKEGRQAVMAADYAIAQFRFLVPLLLVHGQWSYRRMCKLVLYSFWKNMLFAITNICFGFYSAFSAQTLYDSWVVSFYNILFTGLPIFLVAAFDQPISRRQIMDYPPLYRNGIRHQSFSSFKYWQWQSWAVVQAVIIMMFSIAAFRNDILLGSGQTLDAFALGLEIMTAVILTVNAKIFLVTNTWTVWNHIAVWGSVAAWFLFIILYAPIPTSNLLGPNLIGWVTFKAMSSAFYWLGAILITACAILPDLVYCYLRRTYLPENYHVIQEMHLLNEEDQRKLRRRERAKRMRRKLTSLVKRRRVTYTGFAFSQAPGVRDVMLTLGLAPVPSEKKDDGQKRNNKQREDEMAQDDEVFADTTTRRGARADEAFHDDLFNEHNSSY